MNRVNEQEVVCGNKLNYEKVCFLIKDSNGPWKDCIHNLPKDLIESLFNFCVMDLCAFEGDPRQTLFKCYAFEELTSKCYLIANSNFIDWRSLTNCGL